MESSKLLGAWGEFTAAQYLQKKRYKIVATGYRSRFGEIDLIAKKDGYLVFVEVKYRADERFGAPEEAVDFRKQKKIIAAAQYYMYKNRIPFNTPCRFDVAGVIGSEIRVTENAFWM